MQEQQCPYPRLSFLARSAGDRDVGVLLSSCSDTTGGKIATVRGRSSAADPSLEERGGRAVRKLLAHWNVRVVLSLEGI